MGSMDSGYASVPNLPGEELFDLGRWVSNPGSDYIQAANS